MNNIELRPATMSDAETLFKWRNDPLTRKMSTNSEEVYWHIHLDWLQKSLRNPNRQIWIAWHKGCTLSYPVGTCRWDYDSETDYYELSWTVCPLSRGQKIGKIIVDIMVHKFLQDKNIKAEIKENNHASFRIASYVGMEMHTQVKNIVHFRKRKTRMKNDLPRM